MVSLSFSFFRNLGFLQKKKEVRELFLFRIFPTPLGVRESAETREMRFQVVNCPSQVCTLRVVLLTHREREREIFLSFFLSLNSFFVLLSFSSSAF